MVCMVLLLDACVGQQYAIPASTTDKLSQISVNINGESVAFSEFSEHMSYLLYRDHKELQNYKYTLIVEITRDFTPSIVQTTTDIVQETVVQHVKYALYRSGEENPIHTEYFDQFADYNTQFSPYTTYLEKEHLNVHLARYAAQEIYMRLIIFFNNNQ